MPVLVRPARHSNMAERMNLNCSTPWFREEPRAEKPLPRLSTSST